MNNIGNGFAVFQLKKPDRTPGAVVLMPFTDSGGVSSRGAVDLGETADEVAQNFTVYISQQQDPSQSS